MLTRVVRVRARTVVGDTLMVDGRPVAVMLLLPRRPGRARAARATHDPPCGACERALHYDVPRRLWRCPDCGQTYDRGALADLLTEHLASGVRAGSARRDRSTRAPWVRRGAPGAAALLLQAADAGGALSRAALLKTATGRPERHALRWALRDAGDAPVSPERCREAAASLSSLTHGDLGASR